MKKNIIVHAILKTLSPLHIASPEGFRYLVNESGHGNVVYSSEGLKESIACTGIQTMRFGASVKDASINSRVPVIAANNIAGRMRRHAAALLLDAIKANGEKVDLQTYSAITCGAVTGSPDKTDMTLQEYLESSTHPYVGLFGGGPRMMRRRMRVHNALPVNKKLRDIGIAIGHINNSGYEVEKMNFATSAACFRRNDDIRALLDVERLQTTVTDFENEFAKRQKAIFEDQKKKAESVDGNRNSTVTWSAFEFVVPGVDFDFTIELEDVTDAQIGLFLLSLDLFSKEHLGGQSRNGLGRISLNDVVIGYKGESESSYVYTDNDSIFNNNTLKKDSNSSVQSFIDAWHAEKKSISASALDAMLKGRSKEEKTAEASAKKAAKEAKAAAATSSTPEK